MVKQNVLYGNSGPEILQRIGSNSLRLPRRSVIALILLVALLAFEIFNFDTTRYALTNLLGPVSFIGLRWASILGIAFCAIDFAGLVRLFTPDANGEQPKEVWYLMGAWLLGATMNAVMTWWAVSLTLLNHEFGNEVLSRGQLLQVVPIFVATLVWLTRILFIGALTVTGNHLLFASDESEKSVRSERRLSVPTGRPLTERLARERIMAGAANGVFATQFSRDAFPHVSDELPAFLNRRPVTESEADEELEIREIDPGEMYSSRRTIRPSEIEPVLPSEDVRRGERVRLNEQDQDRPKANGRVRQRPPMPGAKNFRASSRGRN